MFCPKLAHPLHTRICPGVGTQVWRVLTALTHLVPRLPLAGVRDAGLGPRSAVKLLCGLGPIQLLTSVSSSRNAYPQLLTQRSHVLEALPTGRTLFSSHYPRRPASVTRQRPLGSLRPSRAKPLARGGTASRRRGRTPCPHSQLGASPPGFSCVSHATADRSPAFAWRPSEGTDALSIYGL